MTIKFTIKGNQEDVTGHPIPYIRATQRSLWTPQRKRYNAWKHYVREQYFNTEDRQAQLKLLDDNSLPNIAQILLAREVKPIRLKAKYRMDIFIIFKNGSHGDPDNIWKGIADALFANDSNVAGSFDFEIVPNALPRVDVTINVFEE